MYLPGHFAEPWKASQNRDEADRRGVAEGLERDGHEAMARLVRGPRGG